MRKIILLTLVVLAAQNFACTQKTSVTNSVSNAAVSNTAASNKSTTADPAAENARLQAKSCIEAQYQAEAAKYADCLHPEILKAQGGREKVLTDLNKTFQMTGKMNSSALAVSAPTEIKSAGQALVTVVPYKINAASSD